MSNSRTHTVRKQETIRETFRYVTLINQQGETRGSWPRFLVVADSHHEATAKIESGLDRDEYPPSLELTASPVEWGELGSKDVAWLT